MNQSKDNDVMVSAASMTGADGDAGRESELSASSDDPINILIVDDEPRNLTVLETVLNEPGYRLVQANSANQALLALLADEFALIILDISMPDVTGFELAKIIKSRKKTALVPIIFLTAYFNDDQHVLDGYGAGAVDYLHKPVNPGILRSKVSVFADLHKKSHALRLANSALLAEVGERQRAEVKLRELNDTLDQRVRERTDELRESERRYREMINALPAAVYTTDVRGCLNHLNPAAIALYGGTPDRAAGEWGAGWKFYNADQTPLSREDCPLTIALREKRPIVGADLIVENREGRRTPVLSYPTPMLDADGEIVGGINILVDVTERKRTEEQIRLLLNEVSHRSKNMLALVEAIARQTAARSPKQFLQNFSERVRALGASHDLLVKNEWRGIELTELVRSQLAHFEDLLDRRIALVGPLLPMTVAAAQCLGMVVHELATNAAKHGSLSNQYGLVQIAWEIDESQAHPQFKLSWTERDGPTVVRPEHNGFGSTVIKTMAERNLDGEVNLDYAPSGFVWRLQCPAEKTLEPGAIGRVNRGTPNTAAGV